MTMAVTGRQARLVHAAAGPPTVLLRAPAAVGHGVMRSVCVAVSLPSTSGRTSFCDGAYKASSSAYRQRRLRITARAEADPDVSSKPRVPDLPPNRANGTGSSSSSGGSGSTGGEAVVPTGSGSGSSPASRTAAYARAAASPTQSIDEEGFSWGEFWKGDLPGKLALLLGLIVASRVGVYVRLPGVDVEAFAATASSNGLLGYVDALSGGSISKVGLFSLGIIPYINASIVLQLFSAAFPSLKKMQREDGPQGRARFQYYQKLAAFAFAIAQAVGQLTYIRPYVEDWSVNWLAGSSMALVAGAMALVYVADTISELKLGNGTSVLIFANIASSLPSSVGALLADSASNDPGNVAIYFAAFFLTTLGIIYVQEAERRIPVNYSGRYNAGAGLAQQSYLPFKVNATGVMPLIFASSLLGLPLALARFADSATLDDAARALGPGGTLYLPANIALIAFFNYYYTFLQLEPKDLSEQLKRTGAAIPGIRPGKATAEYVSSTLTRMSILGSIFLGALAAAPAVVEALTHLTAFRGFAGTSVLIMVGVATDTARRIRAEQAMAKYKDIDRLYDEMKI